MATYNQLMKHRSGDGWIARVCLLLIAALMLCAPAWAAPGISSSKSTAIASPTTVLANGIATSTITVTVVRNNNSSAGSGITVTLTASGVSSIISPASVVTTNSGIAVFTVKDATVESVTYTAVTNEPGNGATTISQRPVVNFVRAAPTVVKSFTPSSIVANGTSTLAITLTNANTASVTGVTFTDAYPAGLVNSGAANPSTTCGGAATAAAGGNSLSFSGGTIPASGSCTVSVTVTASAAGSYTNPSFTVTSTNAAASTSAATVLTVAAVSAANSTVVASPTTVLANNTSTSTITVTLRDGANLAVAGKTVTLSRTGTTSTISAASGTSDAAGVVTFTVKDSVAETVTYSAVVSPSIAITQTAAVSFVLVPILKTFATNPVAINGPSTMSIILTNSSGASAVTTGFTDNYPSGLVNNSAPAMSGSCTGGVLTGAAGGSTVSLSGVTIAANSACTVTVQVKAAVAGSYTNTATNSFGTTSTATLVVNPISATNSTVSASPTTVLANGTTSSTITVTLNDGAGNPVPGKTVSLSAATGSSVITAVSNANGVATFTVTDTVAEGPIFYTAVDTTDNITVTQTASVTFSRLTAPGVTKAFSPGTIADYGASTLTITLTNPNTGAIQGVEFTDAYPSTGTLANTSSLVLTNSCGGTNPGTIAGGKVLTLSGGTIPASGSCSVSVNVTAAFPGTTASSPISNSTGVVTSTNAQPSSTASATLLVVDVSATNSTVVASPTTVPADNTSTSTITVTLRDGGNNTVAGKDVTLTKSAGSSSTITPATATTDSVGVATFLVKNAISEVVTYTATDTTDTITIVQQAVVTFGVAVGSFNAYETSTSPTNAASGFINTKVAGTAFSLDIVALNAGKTAVLTTFNNSVKVELLGNTVLGTALDANSCPVTSTTIQAPLLGSNPGITNGRSTVAFPAISNAWRDVRVRISYPATGTATLIACSNDNFAIRPNSFGIVVQDANRTTAGTTNTLNNLSITGTPIHNAGQPFTITATANNASASATSNYAGTPTAVLSACSGTACIPAPGTITLGTWSAGSGSVVTDAASYNDVGAFTMKLVDATFASVDSSDGTTAAQREITGTVDVGRFVPDHFELSDGVLINRTDLPTCAPASTFTYTGEGLGATFTLTACNSSASCAGAIGLTTQSYAGAYSRLTPSNLSAYNFAGSTSPTTAVGLTGGAVVGTWANGVLNATLSNIAVTRTTPHAPYTAFKLGIAPTDLDTVVLNPVALTLDLDGTAGNDHAELAGASTTIIRFGRLKISNAHGSDLLALPIPMEAQYWNGTAFSTNTLDSCTTIAATNISMGNYKANLSACKTAISISGPLAAGKANMKLVKPNAATTNNGSVDLTVNLGSTATGQSCVAPLPATAQSTTPANLGYLRGVWTGTGTTYDQNPVSRATLGIYKSGPVIYIREMY